MVKNFEPGLKRSIDGFAMDVGIFVAVLYRVLFGWFNVHWIPPERDTGDYWSFGHSLVTMCLYLVLAAFIHGIIMPAIIAMTVMMAYEYLLDGFRLIDKRGASLLDCGYNVIGLLLAIAIQLLWRFPS